MNAPSLSHLSGGPLPLLVHNALFSPILAYSFCSFGRRHRYAPADCLIQLNFLFIVHIHIEIKSQALGGDGVLWYFQAT